MYPFIVRVNKCSWSCNTIDDPYARVCVLNKVKNMNVKVFNSMSQETRFLVQREWCECKCELNESLCNSKRKCDYKKCWCERKDLDDWGLCGNGYIWGLSTCGCKCNKECKINECLHIYTI